MIHRYLCELYERVSYYNLKTPIHFSEIQMP